MHSIYFPTKLKVMAVAQFSLTFSSLFAITFWGPFGQEVPRDDWTGFTIDKSYANAWGSITDEIASHCLVLFVHLRLVYHLWPRSGCLLPLPVQNGIDIESTQVRILLERRLVGSQSLVPRSKLSHSFVCDRIHKRLFWRIVTWYYFSSGGSKLYLWMHLIDPPN